MKPPSRIYVAGHRGMLGTALMGRLQDLAYDNVIGRAHADLDLTNQAEVEEFFRKESPDFVFLAAARVGGIIANQTYPAEFIYTNLSIQANVIHAAYRFGVKRLIFFGSNCAYPKACPQPMKETYLLMGELERTSEPYAISKIAGMKMCEAYNNQYDTRFITVVPPTLYGPNDDFKLESSHVMSALLRKFHEGKDSGSDTVTVWGSGTPRREFLFVDDLADACIWLMMLEEEVLQAKLSTSNWVINIGTGEDLSVLDLALAIKGIVGYQGQVCLDRSYPDGAPRKLLDSGRIKRMGWSPKVSLREGIEKTYSWYLHNLAKVADGIR